VDAKPGSLGKIPKMGGTKILQSENTSACGQLRDGE